MKEQILEIVYKYGDNYLMAKAEVEKLFPVKPVASIKLEEPKKKPALKRVVKKK